MEKGKRHQPVWVLRTFCILVFRFYRTPVYPLSFPRFCIVLGANGTETAPKMPFYPFFFAVERLERKAFLERNVERLEYEMIFTIQTSDEVAGLDIAAALDNAGIQHTIISKSNDVAAQQSEAIEGCSCSPDWFDPACMIHGA